MIKKTKEIDSTAWKDFAIWLRNEAERQVFDLQEVQPYAGFWAKVSTGRIKSIPSQVIDKLERHFKKSLDELANQAGVALFLEESSELKNEDQQNHLLKLPILAPEHEIFIVWSDGVPDHMWSYVAFKRGYFYDARIKASVLDAECSSDFPEGYGQAMNSCLPRYACGVGTWNEMHELKGWPVAVTHHFVGFAAIGRAPSHIKPLLRDSAQDFGRLMYELAKRRISSKRVGCITETSIEFLQLAAELANECLSNEDSLARVFETVEVAVERTPNMLEELYELGELGWDLIVGHALTHGLALQNPLRYQVYFSWDRLCAIAQKIKSPVAEKLERVAFPVPFMLNFEPQEKDRALVCRLWSVAFRANQQIIRNMPPAAAAQLLGELKSLIPYSNPNDETISPGVFSSVWHKSYRPLPAEKMLLPLDYQPDPLDRHASLNKALTWVREEKELSERAIAKLREKKSNRNTKLAEHYYGLGNYYDAKLACAEQ